MQAFRQNITRIKGLSDRRRMPLLGKIRLGVKVKHPKSGKEYPKETEHFVCPNEVQAVFGKEPKALDIMFPMSDIDAVFPTAYIWYGSSKGVKCRGDGEMAECWDNDKKAFIQKTCPCSRLDSGECKQVGRLLFMIPRVSVSGVYQISTSSFNSIVDIQSGLDYVRAMVGRFHMIRLQIRRIPTVTHHDEKRQTHYTIQLTLPPEFNEHSLADLRKDNERVYSEVQYRLPAPIDENPEMDEPDIVADEEDEPLNGEPVKEPEIPGIEEISVGIGALIEQLKEAKANDPEAFLAGKRNARITQRVDRVTIEQAQEWLMEIEAYQAHSE